MPKGFPGPAEPRGAAADGLPPLALSRPYHVLCLGLNSCDYLYLLETYPQRGQKSRIIDLVISGGGQSATAACALARLGRRVAYAGVCGDDQAGLKAGPWLREFGVDPAGLRTIPGAGSQQAFITVDRDDGERTISWYRDEACRLAPAHLDPDLIASCRVLHLDGHFLEASLEAARIANRHGVIVSLDGEQVYPGSEKLIPLCHVVMGCQDFAQRLTGQDDPQKALAELARMGPAWAGRTMGARGAEMLVGGHKFTCPAFPVEALDTTGAGDIFHAGMVHAILEGQPPQEALQIACALAAISVTGLGGRSALPDRQGLESFLAKHQ